MAEPVNERPIFPAPVRNDSLGFSIWSTAMIRQLTAVFQQYGYRLNNSPVLGDDNIFTGDNEFNSMPTVGDELMWEYDTNANGAYLILFGVVQVCWKMRLTLPFQGASACEATWTLPRAFAGSDWTSFCSITPPTAATAPSSFATGATPVTDEIGLPCVGSHTASNCLVRVVRQSGETSFVAGDNMYANVIAIGTPS